MANFFKCSECGGIVLEMSAPPESCGNNEKKLLKPNTTDAAGEKHVPVASAVNGNAKIAVGAVPHPMEPEHYIEWIYVKTSFGGIHCNLEPGNPPEALLNICPEEVEEVYAYCNLHGLWKASEPVFDIEFDHNDTACSPEFSAGCVDPSSL